MGNRSGLDIMAYMDDEAIRELKYLAERFPLEMKRSLGGIGYFMLMTMRSTIRAGGPRDNKWRELSLAQQYRRLEYATQRAGGQYPLQRLTLKRHLKNRKSVAGQSIPDAFSRWKKRGQRTPYPMARLLGALRYEVDESRLSVRVGGLKPSIGRYLRAVQDGAALPGEQVSSVSITPAMRRLFWAAGVPLGKRKRILDRPKRPLVDPLFRKCGQAMIDYIRARVDVMLIGPYETRDATARRVGLYLKFGRL